MDSPGEHTKARVSLCSAETRALFMVEQIGIEPTASSVRGMRSPS